MIHDSSTTLRSIPEDELLQTIYEAAMWQGWRLFHIRRSDKAQQQGHAGWPDLFMVKGSRALALELKRQGNKPTASQSAWLDALNQTCIEAHVIYPDDLDTVLEWLRAA